MFDGSKLKPSSKDYASINPAEEES